MTILNTWATRHGVSPQALDELRQLLICDELPAPTKGVSEAAVQSAVRLEAADVGARLWRNNVGALVDKRGVPIRYGLCNETAALNKRVKSADLVGIKPVLITQDMVGGIIGQFVSREVKKVGWHWSGNSHEIAQLAWAEMIIALGGDAAIVNGVGSL